MYQFQPSFTSLHTMTDMTAPPYTNVMLGIDELSQVDMGLLASCL